MRIGVVTFHDAANYGAALQSYALQETLLGLGAEVEFVNFPNREVLSGAENDKPALDPALFARLRKYPRLAQERCAFALCRALRNERFEEFRRNFLKIAPYCSKKELPELNNKYDCFIAGSDQVWNYEITGPNPAYLLDFAEPGKRCSYAASFGLESIPPQLHAWYGDRLAKFQRLSVREKSGQTLVRELAGREAELCLDPSLLLEREQWARLSGSAQLEESCVLVYLINYDPELHHLAKAEAARRGLPLRLVSAGLIAELGQKAWHDTDVTEFVRLFQQAALVLTDSFHGLALSTIFRKNFQIGVNGVNSSRGSRLRTLLETLGLEERAGTAALMDDIDWQEPGEKLEKARQASLAYLRSIAG